MWVDNASDIDMLFYKPYADVILKILSDEKMTPVTIGLFGPWGAGKSTLLNFIDKSISEKDKKEGYRCIKINAWMLEGYDDAKAAIIEALLDEINESKNFPAKAKEKAKSILKKVNWLKVGGYLVKKGIATATSLATMNPIPIIMSMGGDIANAAKTVEGIEKAQDEFTEKQITRTIREVKDEFEALLAGCKIKNLVVIIDDLDRCMPGRIVETLEAVKLFLSVKKSTFIFAVDEAIVRYAIKRQYPQTDMDSKLDISKDYIEKIIQIPVTLPELSAKDIENYLMLLVVEKYVQEKDLSLFISDIMSAKLLVATTNIAKNQITEILDDHNVIVENQIAFAHELEVIDKIRGVVSSSLKGNPRQAKRFLNAFNIKKELAGLYFGDAIELSVLAKLLALSLISHNLFLKLQEWACDYTGDITKLHELVDVAESNVETIDDNWKDKKMIKWLKSEPKDIYTRDLSQYFYLTRDIAPERDDIESQLNEYEKKAMSEITNSPQVLIENKIKTLKNNVGIRLERIIKVVLELYNDGKFDLGRLQYFVIHCPDYRATICDAIAESTTAFIVQNIGYHQNMLKNCPNEMKAVINKMPESYLKQVKGEK